MYVSTVHFVSPTSSVVRLFSTGSLHRIFWLLETNSFPIFDEQARTRLRDKLDYEQRVLNELEEEHNVFPDQLGDTVIENGGISAQEIAASTAVISQSRVDEVIQRLYPRLCRESPCWPGHRQPNDQEGDCRRRFVDALIEHKEQLDEQPIQEEDLAGDAEIIEDGPMGTIAVEYRTFGDESCHCMSSGEKHGPYRYRAYWKDGTVKKEYLGKAK